MYEHPLDPRRINIEETPEYAAMESRLLEGNVMDLGRVRESLSECDDYTIAKIVTEFSAYNIDLDKLVHLLNLGRIVYSVIDGYCTPEPEDVLDAMHRQD